MQNYIWSRFYIKILIFQEMGVHGSCFRQQKMTASYKNVITKNSGANLTIKSLFNKIKRNAYKLDQARFSLETFAAS